MADNNTSEYEDSDDSEVKSLSDLVGATAMYTISGILGTLTLIAFIYGVISWCLIKKFRHFRNYVLLSAIAAECLYWFLWHVYMTIQVNDILPQKIKIHIYFDLFTFVYCGLCYHLWLLVLCYIFYVDFVKVFRLDIHRRYLKSSLLSWGMPFMSSLFLTLYLLYSDDSERTVRVYTIVSFVLILAPIAMNLIIYMCVLYSLFCSKISKSTSTDKWSRFYISTLIFVLSNVSVLAAVIRVTNVENWIIYVCAEILDCLNNIAIVLYIIVMKSNRLVWGEYLSKRSKRTELELK